jgi:hypothetical protein
LANAGTHGTRASAAPRASRAGLNARLAIADMNNAPRVEISFSEQEGQGNE